MNFIHAIIHNTYVPHNTNATITLELPSQLIYKAFLQRYLLLAMWVLLTVAQQERQAGWMGRIPRGKLAQEKISVPGKDSDTVVIGIIKIPG